MAKLDKEKFDLYKEISEIEAHIDYSAGELAKLKEELTQLQARDVAAEVIIGGAA
jgi:Spc24 subunit of Ndc80